VFASTRAWEVEVKKDDVDVVSNGRRMRWRRRNNNTRKEDEMDEEEERRMEGG
jgi:hypothetical protein